MVGRKGCPYGMGFAFFLNLRKRNKKATVKILGKIAIQLDRFSNIYHKNNVHLYGMDLRGKTTKWHGNYNSRVIFQLRLCSTPIFISYSTKYFMICLLFLSNDH